MTIYIHVHETRKRGSYRPIAYICKQDNELYFFRPGHAWLCIHIKDTSHSVVYVAKGNSVMTERNFECGIVQ